MRWRVSWFATIAGVGLGLLSLVLVLAATRPAGPPIVLHFAEAPIFMGPHGHPVTAMAFSPDGKTLATGDGDLRLWDAATGKLKSIHADDATRGIDGIAFSPDGRLVAVVGGIFGKAAVLWDTATGKIARDIAEPPGSDEAAASSPDAMIYKGKPIIYRVLSAVAFSPDGKVLATAGEGVVLRDVESGSVLATLAQPAKRVKAIAFSPDGKMLATAAEDHRVRLWSVPGGVLEATLTGPTQPLAAVAFAPDGVRVVATSSGKRSLLNSDPLGFLWVWDRPDKPVRKIELGGVNVHQVAFAGPTTVVLAAGREVLSLDLQAADATQPRRVNSHSEDVLTVAVSPDGKLVASGSADRTADVVDIATGKLVYRLPGLNDIFSAVAASSDGRRLATATIDRRLTNRLAENASFAARYKTYFSDPANVDRLQASEVRIWSNEDGRLLTMPPLPACQVTAVEFIPGSDQLVVAGWIPGKGSMLSLWDSGSSELVRDFAVQQAEVLSIAVSPDGRALASGDAQGSLDLWDVQSGAKTRSHKLEGPIEAVAFSPDGKRLAAGGSNQAVRLLDAARGEIVRTLKSRSFVESLEFSPDGNLLAAGTRDPGLELWDLRTDADSRTLKVEGDYLATMPGFVAFSPDGRFVVCGGHGKDIAVFDVASGTMHCELRGHFHPATVAVFLPDGTLVSGGEERTVRLWDVKLGQGLATWVAMPADAQQGWSDQWVGYKPSGEFVGSAQLDRLVGWQTGGDFIPGPEIAPRRRVEGLFERAPAGDPGKN